MLKTCCRMQESASERNVLGRHRLACWAVCKACSFSPSSKPQSVVSSAVVANWNWDMFIEFGLPIARPTMVTVFDRKRKTVTKKQPHSTHRPPPPDRSQTQTRWSRMVLDCYLFGCVRSSVRVSRSERAFGLCYLCLCRCFPINLFLLFRPPSRAREQRCGEFT